MASCIASPAASALSKLSMNMSLAGWWFPTHLKSTADGQNSAPVDMVNIPSSTGFHTCEVVQDFVYQEYYRTLELASHLKI